MSKQNTCPGCGCYTAEPHPGQALVWYCAKCAAMDHDPGANTTQGHGGETMTLPTDEIKDCIYADVYPEAAAAQLAALEASNAEMAELLGGVRDAFRRPVESSAGDSGTVSIRIIRDGKSVDVLPLIDAALAMTFEQAIEVN